MLRAVGIVLVIALIVGGVWMWHNRTSGGGLGSGDVFMRNEKAQMEGGQVESNGQPVKPMPSRSDAPGTINGEPVANGTAAANGSDRSGGFFGRKSGPISDVPSSDSQASNAPNGARFAGSGKFQWYRQGEITYRVDTETGAECVMFASKRQWREPLVMQHGCGTT